MTRFRIPSIALILLLATVSPGCIKPTYTEPPPSTIVTTPVNVQVAEINVVAIKSIRVAADLTDTLWKAGKLTPETTAKVKDYLTKAQTISRSVALELKKDISWTQQRANLIALLATRAIDIAVPDAALANQLASISSLFVQILGRLE